MENIDIILSKLKEIEKVEAIILFGSQVTGRAREDSDIDLAVLMSNSATRDEELEVIGWGNDKLDISIFHKLPLIIQFRVFRDGKVLYCKDKKIIYDLKTMVFKRYLDFQLYIDNFYKRIIKNV